MNINLLFERGFCCVWCLYFVELSAMNYLVPLISNGLFDIVFIILTRNM
ncbi:hypothetical protein OIU74_002749 [Salix koriyanagi]|uniref:Uncharacterized protein n=1 Tax=Salix koriyanagi TaxID=2511006 RepID=A0A9Q0X580_9ROSI|nr:hypothetical protein OIU74_002749 [Salix koriyanagi]